MKVDRLARVNNLLRREVSEQLYRVLASSGADMAPITVTHVETSSDLRKAWVYISVLGDEGLQRDALNAVRRARADLQQAVNRDMHLKYTPRLHFKLDDSLRAGDSVLQILSEIDDQQEPEAEEPTDG